MIVPTFKGELGTFQGQDSARNLAAPGLLPRLVLKPRYLNPLIHTLDPLRLMASLTETNLPSNTPSSKISHEHYHRQKVR